MNWRFVLLKKVINKTNKRRVLNDALNIVWNMRESPEKTELERVIVRRRAHIKGS